ncbi:MAG: aldo/keto reductase, partial [Pseudomonadota bacterium]
DRVSKIEAVCQSHNVRLIEAALRFPLHHPCVVSTVPGAQAVGEVEDNAKNISATIPDGLWSDLKSEGLVRQDAPTP